MSDGRRAAFVDRDGTIVVERGYLADPAGVELIPGAADALRALQEAGWLIITVSNQSGIARGYYGVEAYHAVQARLEALLAGEGVRIDGSYFCPHHPTFTGPCECRKPATGLYRAAARDHGLDLARSAYIGDRRSDVLPGLALGGQAILVRTGYGEEHAPNAPPGIAVHDDLPAAALAVLGHAQAVDTQHDQR